MSNNNHPPIKWYPGTPKPDIMGGFIENPPLTRAQLLKRERRSLQEMREYMRSKYGSLMDLVSIMCSTSTTLNEYNDHKNSK